MTFFKIGDMVVYPTKSIAEVVDIKEKYIFDSIISFYLLNLIDNDVMIIVPINKASEIGIRKIITEDDVQKIFEILQIKEIREHQCDIKKLKTSSLFEIAEIYRNLKLTKKLLPSEQKLFDIAKDLLIEELSFVKNLEKNIMKYKIEEIFQIWN